MLAPATAAFRSNDLAGGVAHPAVGSVLGVGFVIWFFVVVIVGVLFSRIRRGNLSEGFQSQHVVLSDVPLVGDF